MCKNIINIDNLTGVITEDSQETYTTIDNTDTPQDTMTDKENTKTSGKLDLPSRKGSFVIGLQPVGNDACSDPANIENSKSNDLSN